MAIESSYSLVLWAVPRFRRPSSYPAAPRHLEVQVNSVRDNLMASSATPTIESERLEADGCLPIKH
jgi:hypothetical protein